MKISKEKKILLIKYNDYKCQVCKKEFLLEELEIHRIKEGDSGGTYEHRNCMVTCINCHKVLSSAQRIARGISS